MHIKIVIGVMKTQCPLWGCGLCKKKMSPFFCSLVRDKHADKKLIASPALLSRYVQRPVLVGCCGEHMNL